MVVVFAGLPLKANCCCLAKSLLAATASDSQSLPPCCAKKQASKAAAEKLQAVPGTTPTQSIGEEPCHCQGLYQATAPAIRAGTQIESWLTALQSNDVQVATVPPVAFPVKVTFATTCANDSHWWPEQSHAIPGRLVV